MSGMLIVLIGNLQSVQSLAGATVAGSTGAVLNPNNAYISCDDNPPYVSITKVSSVDPMGTFWALVSVLTDRHEGARY